MFRNLLVWMAQHRHSVTLAAALTMFAVLLSGVAAWRNAHEQDEMARVVIRSHRVLGALNQIETTMIDAETGQRGFLLTGDERFLEPYRAASGTGLALVIRRPSIDRLLGSVEGGMIPSQRESLERVRDLVRTKLAELAETIALYQAGRTAEANRVVSEGRGKRVMDTLRVTLSSMRSHERDVLAQSERRRDEAATRAMWSSILLGAASLATVALLVATSHLSARSLRRSEQHFRMLADNISQHAWSANTDGTELWFNRRWVEYTGLDAATTAVDGWQKQVQHPDHYQRVTLGFRRAIEAGVPWEDIFPLRGADGVFRWFLSRALPIRDEHGQIARWFGTNTDVDDRLRLEHELMDANRRKDEFIATLAHELRNPLAPIQAGVELMKMTRTLPPQLLRTRDIMDRQLGHLVRLIDDLLDVSRITSGKLELQKAPVPVKAILDSALEVSRLHIEASRHELDVVIAPEPLVVDGDLVRLAQVLTNLLNNAAKYTPDGGHLRVVIERDGHDVLIRVSDDGIGIDPAVLPNIFDLFAQAHDAREQRKGGIGIGLSIARRLVEMHGGSLDAQSAGLGRGSAFIVRLPLAQDQSGQLAHAAAAPVGDSASKRILILDDNEDAALTLSTLLELGGHALRVAHTGAAAIELARAFRPEIALLDIGLPDMSGHDVARALRTEPSLAGIRLVALTGWGGPQDRLQSKDAGFDHHLTKPVTLEALQEVLPDLSILA